MDLLAGIKRLRETLAQAEAKIASIQSAIVDDLAEARRSERERIQALIRARATTEQITADRAVPDRDRAMKHAHAADVLLDVADRLDEIEPQQRHVTEDRRASATHSARKKKL